MANLPDNRVFICICIFIKFKAKHLVYIINQLLLIYSISLICKDRYLNTPHHYHSSLNILYYLVIN